MYTAKQIVATQAMLFFVALLLVHTAADALPGEKEVVSFSEDDDVASSSCSLLQVGMHLGRSKSPEVSLAKRSTTSGVVASMPSASEFAAETLAAAWLALPRTAAQSINTIAFAILAVFFTLGMAISFMKSEGNGKSIFTLVAYPVSASAAAARKAKGVKGPSPPWETPERTREYTRQAQKARPKADSKKTARASRGAGKDAHAVGSSCGAGRVPLPRLCPGWDGGAALTEGCAVVNMEALKQLRKTPVDVMNASGAKILQAAVRDAGDGFQLLELTISGLAGGPHAVIRGVGNSGLNMEVFGHGASQPYFSLVGQAGGGSRLLRAGQLAMLMQAGFPADLRVMALNADGDFLASGGRYLGVQRRPDEVWKLRLCSGVDCLLVIACIFATILTHLPVASSEDRMEVHAIDDVEAELNDEPIEDSTLDCSHLEDSDFDAGSAY